ncbi:hypothetical protein BDP81DRAFT_157112 [Colletotrichum phormii]|uniref:Uncharacterized protein n=1 Tax=Colletotrichum phormii TaxID=359342 RepID=A0AAI9ZXH3_9PEZI|nr:uncharacterized protein BDP81DRAFT_157112 [Colletotrichum phormii]KAK1640017.1 hypothetical protein BDP81DRAFT_157112 [Colletotrichum phormii]
MRAYVSTVEAEAEIDPRITGSLRTVCAFEVLKIYIGAPYNYYPITYRPWAHLNKAEVTLEGYLFSAVAQWLIAHPEDLADVDTMSSIAKRWNPSMAMTRDNFGGPRSQAWPLIIEDHKKRTARPIPEMFNINMGANNARASVQTVRSRWTKSQLKTSAVSSSLLTQVRWLCLEPDELRP